MDKEQPDRRRLAEEMARLNRQGCFSVTVLPEGLHIYYSEEDVRRSAEALGLTPEGFWEVAHQVVQTLAAVVVDRVDPAPRSVNLHQNSTAAPPDRDVLDVFDLADVEAKYRLLRRARASVYLGGEVVLEERSYEDNSRTRTALLSIAHTAGDGTPTAVSLPLTLSDIRDLQRILDQAARRLEGDSERREVIRRADEGDQVLD